MTERSADQALHIMTRVYYYLCFKCSIFPSCVNFEESQGEEVMERLKPCLPWESAVQCVDSRYSLPHCERVPFIMNQPILK